MGNWDDKPAWIRNICNVQPLHYVVYLLCYYTYLISFSVTISCTVTLVWHATGVTIKCMSIAVTSKMLIKNMMLIRDLVHKPKKLSKKGDIQWNSL